jgi:hypothetical protein
MERDEAAGAIAAIADSRTVLADRIVAPCWYHPALGLLAGAAIAEADARSWLLFGWSIAGYTVGCGALLWLNQRRVGVAMKYFDPRTRLIFSLQVMTLIALIAVACWLELDRGIHGVFLIAGALAVAVTVAFGRWSDGVLRARLQASR